MLLALVVAFPVMQMLFFGTTDYRRPADAAVILGARVMANGALSTAAEDRVRTGVDLYDAGLVRYLVMSGGVGESGVDETVAMRRRAMQLGVPASAIILDHTGVNTDATVANTTGLFRARDIERVLAVSQSWHLPRVKLAYLAAGWNVSTVPATTSRPITQTPYLMLREIPAFWKYWARSL
ncbi:MAG: YdcF family protein [Coriobacteriales bacterium]|nr:YdcF family protein [Coriobacteriales bacterium]